MGGLFGPDLDLLLALRQQLADLGAAPLHFAQTAVEHLDLLAALGEFEARLGERLLLLVAVGAEGGNLVFKREDGLPLGGDLLLGLGQGGLGADQTLLRLDPGLLEAGQFTRHALEAAGHFLAGLVGVARLGLHGGHLLRGGEHVLAVLLEAGFGRGQRRAELVDERALLVVELLLAGQLPGGLAQVDLALHDAAARPPLMAAVDEAAPVHQLALRRGHEEEREVRIRPPEFEKGIQILRDVARREQTDDRMRGVQVGQRDRGRLQERRQPGGRAFRDPAARFRNLQAGAADPLLLEVRQNLPGHGKIGHGDGLDRGAEQRLEGLAKFGLHLEAVGDGGNPPAGKDGIEPPLQEGLRPLAEALPFFMKLLQETQPRCALGQRAVQLLEVALSLAEALRGLLQHMLRGLHLVVGAALLDARGLEALLLLARPGGGGGHRLAHLRHLHGELVVPHHAGLRLDLIPGAVGAQARQRVLQLEQIEFRLLELLFLPAQLPLDDGQLAVALLEGGVGTAEQAEWELLVLRPAVGLRGHLAELHLELGQVVAARLDALLEAGLLDPGETGLILGLLLLRTQIKDRLLRLLHALVVVAAAGLDFIQLALAFLQRGAVRLGRGAQGGDIRLQSGDGGAQLPPLPAAVGEAEVAETETEALVAHGLGGLAAQAADLAADLGDHVGHARQILVGQQELAEGLAALALVARDARGLLENGAPFLGLRG